MGFAAFAIIGDAFSGSLICVQHGRLNSHDVLSNLKTRRSVLCLSAVVLEFDAVEGS